MINYLDDIKNYIQIGSANKVRELIKEAKRNGYSSKEILDQSLLLSISEISNKFKDNKIYVPEVLVAARAVNAGMEILRQVVVGSDIRSKGKAVLGTIKGDLHDIGKNLVKIMFEGKGIDVIDLGVDVPPEKFVQAAIDNQAKIIACSALLTTTMSSIREIVICANERCIRQKVKIMIGGAPVSQNFCNKIGADYYAIDAATASEFALKIS